MPQVNNLKYLKDNRKSLRNNLTPAEATLWKLLKSKQLEGRKFRRQHSVGNYILDFYCPAERLCVELDGAHHFTEEGMKYDEERTAYLKSVNIQVVRFENKIVFDDPGGLLDEIKSKFGNSTTPASGHPS
jgi:very-short-patch-repair endonuclease